jgi:hypothetical protein
LAKRLRIFWRTTDESSSLISFSVLNPAAISHCFYVEITTIGFGNYPFAAVSRRRGTLKPVTGSSEVEVAVYSEERPRTSALSGMLLLTSVIVEPLESHPVDRLLPQSRLQQMKKLLQASPVAPADSK